MNQHGHYFKDVSKLQTVDVYRVLELFKVVNPSIAHAVKKLLVAGGRGAGKDITQDIREAMDSLQRWIDMRQEDALSTEDKGLERAVLNSTFGAVAPQSAPGWVIDSVVQAHNRIYDLLLGHDAQAYKEARKYLERADPGLYAELQKHRAGAWAC